MAVRTYMYGVFVVFYLHVVPQYSRITLIQAAWDQVVSVILKMPVTLKQVF